MSATNVIRPDPTVWGGRKDVRCFECLHDPCYCIGPSHVGPGGMYTPSSQDQMHCDYDPNETKLIQPPSATECKHEWVPSRNVGKTKWCKACGAYE